MTPSELHMFVVDNRETWKSKLKKLYPKVYCTIKNKSINSAFGLNAYHYIHGDSIPRCKICDIPTRFWGIHDGYSDYCSNKCKGTARNLNSREIRKCKICNKEFTVYKKREKSTCSLECSVKLSKTKEVNDRRQIALKNSVLKKYGVDHISKIPGFGIKIKKTKLERHGDENYVNLEKTKKTKLERYGDSAYSNPSKNKKTKLARYGDENYNNREKFKETNLKLYGVEYPIQSYHFKEKQKTTLTERYGGTGFQSTEIYNRIKKTNIEKYGHEVPTKNKTVSDKIRKTWNENSYDKLFTNPDSRLKDKFLPLFTKDEYIGARHDTTIRNYYPFKCLTCNSEFMGHTVNGLLPRCTICYPPFSHTSKIENEISDFLKALNVGIEYHNRTILGSHEIDIVINDKIGIECDGVYWHSEISGKKDKFYHINKTIGCQKNNIRLLHIWDWEWINKKAIIQSMLLNTLGLSSKKYARKCIIREITDDEKSNFLNDNHLQGNDNSSIRLGLYENNELISVMTFGKSRYDKSYDWELLRFCHKINHTVIGGADRLFKYYIRKYDPKSIITYSDKRHFSGNIYKTLGMNQLTDTLPSYHYLIDNYTNIGSRLKFQKHKLKNILPIFDPNLTEWENMQLNGYDRIWDCGHYKFEWINPNIVNNPIT